MPIADLGSYELHYECHGSGEPLILVPGLGGVGSFWRPQIAVLARDFRVYTYDHRGTGRSSRTHMEYSVEQMAVELLALMDHLEIEHAHIVGHSTGGAIGQILAIDHPQRVDRLVLYSTWTKSDAFMRRVFDVRKLLLTSSGAAAYIKATPILLFPDWYINAHAAEFADADANIDDFPAIDIAVSRCDAVINFNRADQLAAIKSPTLVLCAEDDFLTPIYFSEQLAQEITGAHFIRLPRGGHASSQTVPEEFNAAVVSFLHNSPGTVHSVHTMRSMS